MPIVRNGGPAGCFGEIIIVGPEADEGVPMAPPSNEVSTACSRMCRTSPAAAGTFLMGTAVVGFTSGCLLRSSASDGGGAEPFARPRCRRPMSDRASRGPSPRIAWCRATTVAPA